MILFLLAAVWLSLPFLLWYSFKLKSPVLSGLLRLALLPVPFVLMALPFLLRMGLEPVWTIVLPVPALLAALALRVAFQDRIAADVMNHLMILAGVAMTVPVSASIGQVGGVHLLVCTLMIPAIDAILQAFKPEQTKMNRWWLLLNAAAVILPVIGLTLLAVYGTIANQDDVKQIAVVLPPPLIAIGFFFLFVRSSEALRLGAFLSAVATVIIADIALKQSSPYATGFALIFASFGFGISLIELLAVKTKPSLIRNLLLHLLVIGGLTAADLYRGEWIRGVGWISALMPPAGAFLFGVALYLIVSVLAARAWSHRLQQISAGAALAVGIALIAVSLSQPRSFFRPFEQIAHGVLLSHNAKISAVRDYRQPAEGANLVPVANEAWLTFDGVQEINEEYGHRKYYRILCDAASQALCQGSENVFVPADVVYEGEASGGLVYSEDLEEKRVWLVKSAEEAERARNTRGFLERRLADPSKISKETMHRDFFVLWFQHRPETSQKLELILDLITFHSDLTDSPRYAGVQAVYAAYRGKQILNDELSALLLPGAQSNISRAVEDFPFSESSWSGLAQSFNRQPLEVKREILQSVFKEEGGYDPGIEGRAFGFAKRCSTCTGRSYTVLTLDGKLTEAILLERKPASGTEPVEPDAPVNNIKAVAEYDSLYFTIEMPDSELVLKPMRMPDYLLRGGPAISQHAVTAPTVAAEMRTYLDGKSLKEYKRDLIKIAIRNFQGGYNKEKGKMVYKLDMMQPQGFWIAHAVVSRHPSLTRESDWKGGFVDRSFGVSDYFYACEELPGPISVEWYKPQASEFRLVAYNTCMGNVDEVCFSEYGSTVFTLSFRPADMLADDPAVQFEVEGIPGSCSFLERLMN
ncbi:MAG: hypothetical protein F9K24_05855 [Leptonema illini]|uniref:Uncharacterized protein n=1 Tax=Leptonema illini TaxID=183 RepID=A0A833H3W5_9LEPT|nr:MAG: hypothetical protein F9K24_05855 [Leptonema illini]